MENVEYMLFALFWVCSNPKKSLEKKEKNTGIKPSTVHSHVLESGYQKVQTAIFATFQKVTDQHLAHFLNHFQKVGTG